MLLNAGFALAFGQTHIELLLPSRVLLSETEGVVLLELDEFSLVRAEEDAAHEPRYPQLLHDFEQVYLHVQLAQPFRIQAFVLVGAAGFLPIEAAALFGCDQSAAAKALEPLLLVGPETLRPVVAEDVARHYRLLELRLLLVVVVPVTVLAVSVVVVSAVLLLGGLLPRENLFYERLVDRERLVVRQGEVGQPRDQREEPANFPEKRRQRGPDKLVLDDLVGLGVNEVDEAEVDVCLFIFEAHCREVGRRQAVRLDELARDHWHVIPDAVIKDLLTLLDEVLLDLAEVLIDGGVGEHLGTLHLSVL